MKSVNSVIISSFAFCTDNKHVKILVNPYPAAVSIRFLQTHLQVPVRSDNDRSVLPAVHNIETDLIFFDQKNAVYQIFVDDLSV